MLPSLGLLTTSECLWDLLEVKLSVESNYGAISTVIDRLEASHARKKKVLVIGGNQHELYFGFISSRKDTYVDRCCTLPFSMWNNHIVSMTPLIHTNMQTGDRTGGRVITKHIFDRCYVVDSLLSTKELQQLGNTGGNKLLPMWRNCFLCWYNIIYFV